jgi:hypothetical protein
MNGCDQSEQLRAIIDELTESRERWYGMAKQFAVELTKAKRERDDEREYADCEKQLADELKAERDQARKCAEEMRDLYAAEIDESIAVFPFPWEAQNERG